MIYKDIHDWKVYRVVQCVHPTTAYNRRPTCCCIYRNLLLRATTVSMVFHIVLYFAGLTHQHFDATTTTNSVLMIGWLVWNQSIIRIDCWTTRNTHAIILESRLKTRSMQLIYSYQTFSHHHDSGLFLEGLARMLPSTASVIYYTFVEPFRLRLTTKSAPWTHKEACRLRPPIN